MRIYSPKVNNRIIFDKKSLPILITIGLIVFLISFWIGGVLYENGIHTPIKLLLQGRVDEISDGSFKSLFTEFSGLVKSETIAYTGNNLPTLYLDIPFENLQIIQEKRDEARKTGILLSSDDDYVTATARYNDSAPMDVELRLKGDWTDHLDGSKWSYRIHIEDDAAIEGMRRFSIQEPGTREFVYEWAYHQNLMKEGLLTPRYFFINVIENGENKGIYAMEESFYTELMESQNRRSGVIIRFDEDDMWENMAEFYEGGNEDLRTASQRSGYFMMSDYTSSNISAFGFGGIQKNPVLSAEYETAQELLRAYQNGEENASSVFDLEQIGKYLAITELWGAGHGLAWHNLRFYYNPVTNLLEPIGFDGAPMMAAFRYVDFHEIGDGNYLMMDPEIREGFYTQILHYLDDSYLKSLEEEYGDEAQFYADAMNKSYSFDTSLNWENLYAQRDYLFEQLAIENYVEVLNVKKEDSSYSFSIRNTFFTTVEIEKVEFRDSTENVISSITVNEKISPVLPNNVNAEGKQLIVSPISSSISDDSQIYFKVYDPIGDNRVWILIETE